MAMNPDPGSSSTYQNTLPTHRFRSAYETAASEIASVTPDRYVSINVDLSGVVIMVLGRETDLAAFHDQVVKELPEFDVSRLDNIVTYALALGFAHTRFIAASPQTPISELTDELTKQRETLVSDVSALAKRSFLDGSRLSELRGTNGYKNLVFDVLLLCTMLRDNWDVIAGRTAVQLEELDRIEALTDRLATAVGQKEQGPTVVGPPAETRQRAFALFVEAWDQVRRAIGYLRWEQDDAERYAPSLFAGRGTPRRKDNTKDASQEPAPAVTAPEDPAAGPARGGVPLAPLGQPAAPTPAPNGQTPAVGGVKPASLGMPGSDPLGRS